MDPRTQTAILHPLVGSTLGQYRVEDVLGQGGMGIVYRAQDLKLQRAVAVKILPPDLTADPERRKRFLLEARAAARICHPAVAQVYDVDEQEGTTFIAMELVEGRTVRQLIQNRELDLLGAIDIAIQVSDGLARAHELGIVHRDIKPANVMMTRDGHAKILDFGLAKLTAPWDSTVTTVAGGVELSTLTQTQLGAIKGTPAYMSPEQVKGGNLDARSDLFSLGAMLFEMATGEVPFQRATPLETMHAVAFDDTPSLRARCPHLPEELQRIVTRCLRKWPEDRYLNAGTLAQELRQLRRDTESGTRRQPSFLDRLRDAADRFRHLSPTEYAWLAGGLGAVVIVLYLLTINVGTGSLVSLIALALLLYRGLRNQPQRLLARFVRRVARVPEVRVIACQDGRITVVVDHEINQLYGRIHRHLHDCNRRLFFAQPMSVVIRHDLTQDEMRSLLNAPGVHYVRENADVSAER